MKVKAQTILAIESSCDDTSIAVYKDAQILANVVSSQLDHKKLGGVVPELASRKHLENIPVVYDQALKVAGVLPHEIDAIAVTYGPGLMGSLLVGLNFAKGLSLGLGVPLIAVDHMKAHILAHFIEEPRPKFPFLCLTVSGGHTQLVLVSSPMDMRVLGSTLDDAAGEAFDKAGKMLGLEYPSGPIIDRLAREGQVKYVFPTPEVEGYNFSFSGLKTALLRFLQSEVSKDSDFIQKEMNNICASFQQCIVDYLLMQLKKVAVDFDITEIAIAGGVSANSCLKRELQSMADKMGWNTYVPEIEYCTDNAAMIAMAGYFQYNEGDYADLSLAPVPRLRFTPVG